jgi:hypothetical protein
MYMRWREPTRELVLRPAADAPDEVRERALPPSHATIVIHALVQRNPQALRKVLPFGIKSVADLTRLLRTGVLLLVEEPCQRMTA